MVAGRGEEVVGREGDGEGISKFIMNRSNFVHNVPKTNLKFKWQPRMASPTNIIINLEYKLFKRNFVVLFIYNSPRHHPEPEHRHKNISVSSKPVMWIFSEDDARPLLTLSCFLNEEYIIIYLDYYTQRSIGIVGKGWMWRKKVRNIKKGKWKISRPWMKWMNESTTIF